MTKKLVQFKVETEILEAFYKANKYKSRTQLLKDFMIETIKKAKV